MTSAVGRYACHGPVIRLSCHPLSPVVTCSLTQSTTRTIWRRCWIKHWAKTSAFSWRTAAPSSSPNSWCEPQGCCRVGVGVRLQGEGSGTEIRVRGTLGVRVSVRASRCVPAFVATCACAGACRQDQQRIASTVAARSYRPSIRVVTCPFVHCHMHCMLCEAATQLGRLPSARQHQVGFLWTTVSAAQTQANSSVV